jgi:hypothetical protein
VLQLSMAKAGRQARSRSSSCWRWSSRIHRRSLEVSGFPGCLGNKIVARDLSMCELVWHAARLNSSIMIHDQEEISKSWSRATRRFLGWV